MIYPCTRIEIFLYKIAMYVYVTHNFINIIHVHVIDPPHVPVYNVTISDSITPADLSGFDIIISWTVSIRLLIVVSMYVSG